MTAGEQHSGKTVKQLLKKDMELSERLIKRLKYAGKIKLNSVSVHVNAIVKPGDMLEAFIDFVDEPVDLVPEDIDIDILYEDECLIVLNKQADIVVHPTSTHPQGTIANAVMHHLLKSGISKKVRPVSRLDRDTTGIIIFAKDQFTQEFLIHQMNDGSFIKEYVGIVDGIIEEKSGTIDMPIERKPGSIMLRQVSDTGSTAVTHYEVIEYLNGCTYMKFFLETGRTHQIRVHCQAIGHPLVGETLYSDIQTDLINRQALHSLKVSFIHPSSKKRMELTAPIPPDFKHVLEILKK